MRWIGRQIMRCPVARDTTTGEDCSLHRAGQGWRGGDKVAVATKKNVSVHGFVGFGCGEPQA